MVEERTTFKIGKIPIRGDLVAAPMDGITDSAFRTILKRLGAALCYTEFINAQDVLNHSILARRKMERMRAEERPIGFQIYDNDPLNIQRASQDILPYHPDFIDVNLGCSVARVAGRGAGAGLLLAPDKIVEIFDRLTDNITIPITAKIRLGWDDENLNYLEIAQIIQEHGGQMIAVHGRTRQQGFNGKADWQAIKAIKQAVSIPVIGNGDVVNVDDINRMRTEVGCDAVMIGRASMSNPWLFQERDRVNVSNEEVFELIKEHLQLSLEDYDLHVALVLFRKFIHHYLQPLSLTREQNINLYQHQDPEGLLRAIREHLHI